MNRGEVVKLYFTASEVAEFLNCEVETVRSYCRHNLVPRQKIKGKYYIAKDDLTRLYNAEFSPEAKIQAEKRVMEILNSLAPRDY